MASSVAGGPWVALAWSLAAAALLAWPAGLTAAVRGVAGWRGVAGRAGGGNRVTDPAHE